MFNNKKEISLQ